MKKDINNDTIVNINVDAKEQIFSNCNYDYNDKLNKELSDFIIEKTKQVHFTQSVKLNIITNLDIKEKDVQKIINNHFKYELKKSKQNLRNTKLFIVLMFLVGLILFVLKTIMSKHNLSLFYFEVLLEICSWVFVWDAIDSLIFELPINRKKCNQIQKISNANVNIINQEKNKQNKLLTFYED